MTETFIRFVGGVLWEMVLYGTGRLTLFVATLGTVRAERLSGENLRLGWSGVGRDEAGGLFLSQNLTGLIGGAVWLFAVVLAVTYGRS